MQAGETQRGSGVSYWIPRSVARGSWLTSRWTAGLGVGCKCCHAAGTRSPFGAFQVKTTAALQSINFAKHAANPKHQAAVVGYMRNASADTLSSPSLQEFRTAVDLVNAGTGLRTRKMRCLIWCVAETLKAQDRKAICDSQAITLQRDERKGRLLMRYRAVDQHMGEFGGPLGSVREFGTGAANVTYATHRIMQRMCTEMHEAPRGYRGPQLKLLPGLLQHLKLSVMCITVDSASDETLSAEIMRSNALARSHDALTPNLRFVLRNKAHASRRIICRPRSADPYLKDVVLMFASGRGSMPQIIQHSLDIRRVFAHYVNTSTHNVSRPRLPS